MFYKAIKVFLLALLIAFIFMPISIVFGSTIATLVAIIGILYIFNEEDSSKNTKDN